MSSHRHAITGRFATADDWLRGEVAAKQQATHDALSELMTPQEVPQEAAEPARGFDGGTGVTSGMGIAGGMEHRSPDEILREFAGG